MAHPSPQEPTPDRANMSATGGKNVTQVGGNMTTTTTTTNYNFVFFLIGLLALGGLAWGLNVVFGNNEGGNPSQQQVQPASPAAEPSPQPSP